MKWGYKKPAMLPQRTKDQEPNGTKNPIVEIIHTKVRSAAAFDLQVFILVGLTVLCRSEYQRIISFYIPYGGHVVKIEPKSVCSANRNKRRGLEMLVWYRCFVCLFD